MEKYERLLKMTASVVAIAVPCILLSGFSYHIGHIFTYGLSYELINKDMSDVLVESWYIGVLAIAWLLTKWPYWLGFFAFLVIIGLVSFFYARHAKEKGKDWLFDELSKENQGRRVLGITQWHWCQLGSMFSELADWFNYPLLILCFVGLLTAIPYQRGKADAERQMQIYAESGCDSEEKIVQCSYLIDTSNENKIIAKGLLVSANQERIAIFNNELEVWPLLDSYIIRKQNND
ncbi:hypothetical protein [Methylophaga pinxianii]|uniref:hypothetical protein n=1 Tax=Methylophaga pinxianii TaxID=2881052 RepID=UPI001CF2658D|nr:hypothetical protein [Methylophaga pinxianii]MCB2425439.1 hypothetical protein [Methylophaga pinxianii]UPH44695.1 hypothetical protein LGT42_009235 [Methylophaga pinxianii]